MFNKKILCKALKGAFCGILLACVLLSLCSCMSFDSILDTLMEQEAEDNAVHKPSDESVVIGDVSFDRPDTDGSLFEVSDYRGGLSIDAYNGDDPYVKIPAFIDGKPVLLINSRAISDRELADGVTALTVTDIVVPDSVLSIAASAFSQCRGLKSISLPFVGGGEGLSSNFGYIFGAKDSDGNPSAVPESLETVVVSGTNIADNAFKNCTSLKSIELTVAETVGSNAFADCFGLERVIIPDTVTAMGETPFSGCSSLSSLRLPYIGDGADNMFFSYIFGGKSYNDNLALVPDTLHDLTVNCPDSLPDNTFYECTGLVNLTLNGNVSSVGAGAFYRCKKLKSITVNGNGDYKGFESVGEHSFAYCSALSTVTLWEELPSIPAFCFYNCSSLRSIYFGDDENVIPNTVAVVGEKAFTHCASLMSIQLPDTVTEISDEMFSGCSYLSKVILSDSVARIGNNAFNGCSNLSTVIFGKNVEEIGDYAFSYCTGLKEITVPDTVTVLGSYAFGGCYQLKSATISDNLTEIPEGCFFGCSYLTDFDFGAGKNAIPKGLSSVGEKAFYGCKRLKDIDLANDMTHIPDGFLNGCESLTSVGIPGSVKTVGNNVFSGCTALSVVDFAGESLTALGRECFMGCTSLKSVLFPHSLGDIGRMCFAGCKGLKSLSLHNGISAIGDKAFDGCDGVVFSVSSDSYAYTWLLSNGIGGEQLDID